MKFMQENGEKNHLRSQKCFNKFNECSVWIISQFTIMQYYYLTLATPYAPYYWSTIGSGGGSRYASNEYVFVLAYTLHTNIQQTPFYALPLVWTKNSHSLRLIHFVFFGPIHTHAHTYPQAVDAYTYKIRALYENNKIVLIQNTFHE